MIKIEREMQPPAAGGLGRYCDDQTHSHTDLKASPSSLTGPLPCETSCGFPGQVNSGLHLPLCLLLSGGENSPALNRDIVIVIMIGILVRLALVTIVGCFVFLKMTRRYKWQCPMLILSPRLMLSQEERHPTLGFWAWLSTASPLPPRAFPLIHRPLLHQMLTWGSFPTPSASVN